MASPNTPRSEGMVAIVTGLEDAGLSVTVSDARALGSVHRRGEEMRASPMRSQGQMRTVSSGVQTSAPPEHSRSTTQVARQNRFNPYESTYQVAYGGSRGGSPSPPTSPVRASPTLDIQRLNDQLNELRARIYGQNTMNMNNAFTAPRAPVPSPSAPLHSRMMEPTRQSRVAPVRDVPCYRSSVNLDRARGFSSSNARRDTRASDAFVESLRKYPSSDDRTASVDLIQRLLAYTVSKNGGRKTVHAKRARSLTRHSRDTTSAYMMKSSNKNIQTYTRTRNESPKHIAAVYGKPERRRRVTSPSKSERSEGSPTGQDTTSYDYLKIGSFAQRSTDVRYLNDVSRYVKDTLRYVCNNDEVLCPRMLDRYSAHRRDHHSVEAATLTIQEMDQFAQTSGLKPKKPKRVCRFGDLPNSENSCRVHQKTMGDAIRMKMSEIKEKLCVICNQPPPCICDHPPCPCPENRPLTFKDRLKSLDICDEFRRIYTQQPLHKTCSCPQDVDELIDHTVDDWLKQIPIYAGYTYKEKETRDQIVRELKHNLKEHVGDQIKSKEDAVKCLKYLPMWLPPDERDHDKFKENLVDALMRETIDIDIFTDRVRKWVKALPFLSEAKLDKDKLIADLAKKLKDTAMTTKDLKNDLKLDAYEALESLPVKSCTCLEKEQLAEIMAESIANLSPEVIDGLKYSGEFSYVRKQVEFVDKIRRWNNKIPFEPTACVDREAVTKEFVQELIDIMKKTEAGSLWDSVKGYVQKKLHKMPVQGGYGEIAHQATKLADQLTSDMFAEVVSNWTKTVAFDHESNVDPDIFAHDMTRKLAAAIKNLESEEVDEILKNIICDELNKVPASGSIPLKVSQAGKLAHALSKLGPKDAGKIKEAVKNWLKEVPFEADADPPVDKGKVVNSLAHKINEKIGATRPQEIWSEIKKVAMEEMVALPVMNNVEVEPFADKLADNLVSFLFDDAVYGWARSVPFKPEAVDVDGFAFDLNKKLKDIVMYEQPENFARRIRDIALESLADDLIMCGPEEKEKLVQDLVDTMINSPNKRDKVARIVGNWYKNVPSSTPVPREKIKDFVRKLKHKLTSTYPRELWLALKQAAIDELEHLHTDCLATEMEALAENLANMLAPEEIEDIVKEWAEGIEYVPQADESVDNFTKYLAKKLKDTLLEGNFDEVHDNLRNIIFEEISMAPITSDESKTEVEVEKLLNNLKKLHPDRDHILIVIEKWIKTVPFKSDLSVNKIKITKELSKILQDKIETVHEREDMWYVLSDVTQEKLEKLPVDASTFQIQRFGDDLADMLLDYLLISAIRNCIKAVNLDPNDNVNKKELVYYLRKEINKIVVPKSRENYQEILKDTIAENLKMTCTSAQKDEIANEMAIKIASLPWKPDHFSKTLHRWTRTVPFPTRPAVDKYKFATDLEIKLRNVVANEPRDNVTDTMTSATIASLEKYELKCNYEEKLKMVENLVEQLTYSLYYDAVFDWFKHVPLKADIPLLIGGLCEKMVERLKPQLFTDNPDKKALIKLVNDELMQLPLEGDLGDIEKDIIDTLLKLPKEKQHDSKRQTYAINIGNWLKGVTVNLGAEENEALVKKTLDKLRDLRLKGTDETKIREELKRDITEGVNKSLEGQKVDPGAKVNLVNKLFNQVFDTFKLIGQERKQVLLPKFNESLKNWWAENPELAKLDQKTKEKMNKNLVNKLVEEAIGGGSQAMIKIKVIKIISTALDTIENKLKSQPDLKNKLLTSLSDKIAADMGILPTRQAQEKTESQFRVEATHKVKSVTSSAEIIKPNQSITLEISDINKHENGIPKRDRSIITDNFDKHKYKFYENKSTLIDDLLEYLEMKANIDCLVDTHEQIIGSPKEFERKIDKLTEIISELSSSTLSENKNITKMNEQNANKETREEHLSDIVENNIFDIEYEDTQLDKQLLDHMTDKILSYSNVSHELEVLRNNSRCNRKNEEETAKNSSVIISGKKLSEATVCDKSTRYLANTLSILLAQGVDDKHIMISKIKEEIENIFNIDTDVLNKQANNLWDKLDKTIKQIQSAKQSIKFKNNILFEKNLENAIIEDIKDWKQEAFILKTSISSEEQKTRETIKDFKIDTAILQERRDELGISEGFHDKIVYLDNNIETKSLKNKINGVESAMNTDVYTTFPSPMTTGRNDKDKKHTKICIKRWIEENFELSNSNPNEKKEIEKMAEALAKMIDKIKPQTLEGEIRRKLLSEIKDKIDAALKCKRKQLDNKTRQKFANQLLEQLIETNVESINSSFCTADETQHHFIKAIEEDVESWVESIPDILGKTYVEKLLNADIITHNLLTSLKNLQLYRLDSKQMKKEIVSNIKDVLDNVYERNINTHVKNKLVENLLNKIIKTSEKFKSNPTRTKQCRQTSSTDNNHLIYEDKIGYISCETLEENKNKKDKQENIFNSEKSFKRDVTDWMENIFEVESETIKESRNTNNDLPKKREYLQAIRDDYKIKITKEIDEQTEKTFETRCSDFKKRYNTKLMDQSLSKLIDVDPVDLISSKNMTKKVEKDFKSWTDLQIQNKINAEKEEGDSLSLNVTIKNVDPKFDKFGNEEIQMQNVQSEWKQKQLDEVIKDKKNNSKTRRSLTSLLMDSLGESSSSVDTPTMKALQNDVTAWFDDIQESQGSNATEKAKYKKLLRDLTKNLANLQSINLSKNKQIKNKINAGKEEGDSLSMNVTIKNVDSNFNKLGDKEQKQFDEAIEDKKKFAKTRRSLTSLLMDRLGESSSSVDMLTMKALQNDIKAWFDDIPELQGTNATEKAKNKKLLRDLTKKLAYLQSENLNKDDLQYKMDLEIKRKLDVASKGKGLNSRRKEQLAEELQAKLSESVEIHHDSTTSLRDIVISTQNTKKMLKEFLPEIFVDKPSDKKELEKLSKNLTKLFNNLHIYDMENKAIRNEILTNIKDQLDITFDNTDNYISRKRTYTIAENLLDRVLEYVKLAEKITGISKVFQKDVLSWLEDIPEMASTSAGERKANAKTSLVLAKMLADLYSSSLDEKHIKREVLDRIKDHLEENLEKRGILMKSKEVNKLATKLANTLTVLSGPVLKTTDTQDSIIWKWVNGITILAQEYMSEKRKKANELSKALHKIQKKGVTRDIKKEEMRKEINRWLKEITNRKDKNLDKYTKHDYIAKLVENMQSQSQAPKFIADVISSRNIQVKAKPGCSKDFGVYKESIALRKSVARFNTTPSEVFFQVEEESNLEISKEIDEKIQAKIFGLITHNIDIMDVPEETEIIKTQIMKILVNEAQLPENEAKALTKAILENARQQALLAGADEKQLLILLRQEIRRIIADFPIDENNRDAIEALLMDLEVRRLFEGQSYEDSEEEILKLFKEIGGLSDEDAMQMLGRMGGDYGNLKRRAANQSLKDGEPQKGKSSDDLNFEKKANEVLQEFFDENVNDPSLEKQKRIKKITGETASNLEAIHTDPSDDDNENIERMRKELNKQLRKISLDNTDSVTDLAEGVLEKLKDAFFSTLTPTKSSKKGAAKQRGSKSNATGLRRSPEVDKYKNDLEDVVENWLDNLPIDPLILEDKMYKDTLIKDICGTIIDREKYLQENPNMRLSEDKERQYLKDKCNTWLKKFLDDDDYDIAKARTDDLVSAIIGIPVPKLTNDDTSGKVPTYHDALQDEIMTWVASLPPHLKPKIDDDTLRKHVKDLANRIEKHKGKPDAEEKIRAEIAAVLPSIFEDLGDTELKRLESSLFNGLMKKGFTDGTWTPANAQKKSGKVPTYHDALQDEIMAWVASLPPHLKPKIDDDTLRKHVKDLAKRIEEHKGKPDAEEKIRAEIANVLPLIFEDLDEADLKRLESSLFNGLMKKGFTDGTWTPPIEQSSEVLEQNLIGAVQNWLKQTPMYQKASPEEKRQMELAAMEIAKGIKRAVSIAKLTPGADMDELVREQVMKNLKNMILDPKLKNDEDFLNKTADNLLNYLKGQKMYQDLTGSRAEVLPDLLALAVEEWTRKLPIDIKTPHEQKRFDEAKNNFISRLKQARNQFHPSSPEHEQAIRDEARKFLRANITDPNKKFDEKYIEDMANRLVQALQSVPMESLDPKTSIKPYRSPADTLYDYIEEWVENLPVQGEPEKVSLIKQNLASKLVNKIGELNINPDIFNDAALYQDLLQDEIDKLLEEIPENPELNKYLPALKKDLISKIMDARQRMLEELAGKFYKQHLRDKISTSLPLPSALTLDEEASLELLKDKVADAFINLHYATCDESENQRYKSKISNELNKFVNDVFRHYPCARLDTEKLKNDLHKALTKVPVPRDDSMKSEVEQVRIRDLIYDWMREIPLRQETATEKLHRYKLAAVLAKRLHDIEMEKQSNDFIDSEHKISEEITRFLNKLLLSQGQESAIPDLAHKLMNALQYTEQSRKFFSSSRRCQPNDPNSDICSRYPSTMSPEDKDHLRRIKMRRGQTCNKDVGVCPPLTDSCSQTDNSGQCWIEQRTCPGVKRVSSPKYSSALPHTKDVSCMTPKTSPCHMQPRVLVKEYMWNSPDNCSQSTEQGIQTTPPIFESTERSSCRFPDPLEQPGPYNSFPTPDQQAGQCAPNSSVSPHSICPRQSLYNSLNRYPVPLPNQYLEPTPMSARQSQNPCYCPPSYQERELRPYQEVQKRPSPEEDLDLSSEDEFISMDQPGPSRFCRKMTPEFRRVSPETCRDMKKIISGKRNQREKWGGKFGEDAELWNPCWRFRGRREGFRLDGKDNSKCNCKERIFVSCKGLNNRFADMCQACGNTCPHPRNMFFK